MDLSKLQGTGLHILRKLNGENFDGGICNPFLVSLAIIAVQINEQPRYPLINQH